MDTLGLYYNGKYFKDVFPTNPKPQETWDGIKEQAAQMTKTNVNRLERFDLSALLWEDRTIFFVLLIL